MPPPPLFHCSICRCVYNTIPSTSVKQCQWIQTDVLTMFSVLTTAKYSLIPVYNTASLIATHQKVANKFVHFLRGRICKLGLPNIHSCISVGPEYAANSHSGIFGSSRRVRPMKSLVSTTPWHAWCGGNNNNGDRQEALVWRPNSLWIHRTCVQIHCEYMEFGRQTSTVVMK